MSVRDPKKPWVVVPQYLEATSPADSLVESVRALFAADGFGGTSLTDYWAQQTRGLIEVKDTVVLPWASSDWSVKTHPGYQDDLARSTLVDHAKRLVPNLSDYRGVLAIYNFPCSGGALTRDGLGDVVWGIDGYGSTPAWADDSWRRCNRCWCLLQAVDATRPCAAGGVHSLQSRTYMSVAAADVPRTKLVGKCSRCGSLYDDAIAPRPNYAECPAGGGHVESPNQVRVLAGWKSPPAEREWSACSYCRAITLGGQVCPGRPQGHESVQDNAFHFGYAEIDFAGLNSRGFLAHEMGHCYGFDHGRGIKPRSEDLHNDCWPGAYGDPYDIMSYDNCGSYRPTSADADFALGKAGPSLAITHLVDAQVLAEADLFHPAPGPGTPFDQAVLRPPASDGVGHGTWPGARFGPFLVEYRRRDGWDRNIETTSHAGGQERGVVLVHHVGGENDIPSLVPSMQGRQYLGEFDTFEARFGEGNVGIRADSIAADGSSAVVTFWSNPQIGGLRDTARWLVLPYGSSDSTGSYDRGTLEDLVRGAELYWQDMAGAAFWTAGEYVLTPDDHAGKNGFVRVMINLAGLSQLSPAERAGLAMEAALSTWNPADPTRILPVDLRFFTGIALFSVDGLDAGYVGRMQLDSGVLPKTSGCETADHPRRLEKLPFEVLEVATGTVTLAHLARAMGRAAGFNPAVTPYSGMSEDDSFRYAAVPPSFGSVDWGPMGPALSSAELLERGWLRPGQVHRVDATAGGGGLSTPVLGSVVLSPLVPQSGERNGVVRAEIGPFSFELRSSYRWDGGISGAPVVLAYATADAPTLLHAGEQVTWGGRIPEITGGGRVQVTAMSPDAATLSYSIASRPVLVAGGGRLFGGGTVLFGADGHIHRLPPGDPYEKQAQDLFGQLEQIRERLDG
ncbi:MAG: hypothetical protein ABIR83_01090 [Nakamurella sp.]